MYTPWGQIILFSLLMSLSFTSAVSKRGSLIIYSPSRLLKLMCCYIFCAAQKDLELGNNVAWISMDYFMMLYVLLHPCLSLTAPILSHFS